MLAGKRGMEVWISYVILVLLMVTLGMVVFQWIRGSTEGTTAQLKTIYDSQTCGSVSFIMDVAENAETLDIQVTNNNNLRFNSIIFRQITTDGVVVTEVNATVKPDRMKAISIPKAEGVESLEAIPVYIDFEDNSQVICTGSKRVFEFEA